MPTGTGTGLALAETVALSYVALYHWDSDWVSKEMSAKTLDCMSVATQKIIHNTPITHVRIKAISFIVRISYKINSYNDYQRLSRWIIGYILW